MSMPTPLTFDQIVALGSVNAKLLEALKDIANANWQNWSAPYNTSEEFAAWAKNKAHTAIRDVEVANGR
jgi:hypothetical protein